jgi:protoporphyrinogen oxidase
MTAHRYDLLIAGAGISGLSLACFGATQGWRVLVLEQTHRIGGCLHSHRLGGNGFWLELGAHSCFNSYGTLLQLLEQRGLLGQLQAREKVGFKLWTGHQAHAIPSRLNWLELLLALPRLFTTRRHGQTVAEYYARIAGRRNYARVLGPAFAAVICQPADQFPADLLFHRKPRRKDVLRSFTLPGGLQTIAEALAGHNGVEVLTGVAVQAVRFDGCQFAVDTSDGRLFTAARLGLATPAAVSAGLLRGAFAELAEVLAGVGSAPVVETVGVVVRRHAVKLPPVAGLIAADDSFYSVVSRDTVRDSLYRGFTFHFKPDRLDTEGKLKRICTVLGVQPGQLEEVVAKDNHLPALRLGHQALIQELDLRLTGKPLALTGNYFTGVSLEDCVARSHREYQRLQQEPVVELLP